MAAGLHDDEARHHAVCLSRKPLPIKA